MAFDKLWIDVVHINSQWCQSLWGPCYNITYRQPSLMCGIILIVKSRSIHMYVAFKDNILHFVAINFNFWRSPTATEKQDHDIVVGKMHVIWSKGQETNSKLPDYYRKDELKYHGGGGAQRGWREINFRGQCHVVFYTKIFRCARKRKCQIHDDSSSYVMWTNDVFGMTCQTLSPGSCAQHAFY